MNRNATKTNRMVLKTLSKLYYKQENHEITQIYITIKTDDPFIHMLYYEDNEFSYNHAINFEITDDEYETVTVTKKTLHSFIRLIDHMPYNIVEYMCSYKEDGVHYHTYYGKHINKPVLQELSHILETTTTKNCINYKFDHEGGKINYVKCGEHADWHNLYDMYLNGEKIPVQYDDGEIYEYVEANRGVITNLLVTY